MRARGADFFVFALRPAARGLGCFRAPPRKNPNRRNANPTSPATNQRAKTVFGPCARVSSFSPLRPAARGLGVFLRRTACVSRARASALECVHTYKYICICLIEKRSRMPASASKSTKLCTSSKVPYKSLRCKVDHFEHANIRVPPCVYTFKN